MAAGDLGLDAIADELYALHPDVFAAARDEQVRQARARKEAALAKELAALRRPTLSAWVVNRLWRAEREAVEGLFGIAEGLARAQAQGSGQALRELTARRREAEAALMRRAQALAEEAGVKVTPTIAREAQDTLAAALARPEVAAEIRAGRLVKPATYAGFGELMVAMPPAAPRERPRAAAPPPKPDARNRPASAPAVRPRAAPTAAEPRPAPTTPKADDRAETAAQRVAAERRALAERRVELARATLETAVASLAEEARAAEEAERRHRELRQQAEQLRERVREIEREASAAVGTAKAAALRRAQAEKAHEAAVRALERAEQSAQTGSP